MTPPSSNPCINGSMKDFQSNGSSRPYDIDRLVDVTIAMAPKGLPGAGAFSVPISPPYGKRTAKSLPAPATR